MEREYSEVEAEKHFENNRLWFRRFQTTRSFRKLTQPERAAAKYITQAFVGLAYKYQLRSPRQYSAKSVKEVVMDLFPEKIAATNVFFTSVIPVMHRYFVFLGVQHKISNAKTLIRALESIKVRKLLDNHRDSSNWDSHKKLGMQVLMGYQPDVDSKKVTAYEEDFNMGVPLRFCFDFSVNRAPKNIILLTEKLRKKFENVMYENNK
ncbi:hypothetical protein [Lentilactobacillus parakefiri]|uniref:Uncharacterized protein n=1 Tax=Lentilactobacillus parakefiri TaxID=152332 RepID=A0A224VF73_9LACO|nr:hypothetical protein [Lentilactobacillus parakefiri]KRL61168.1 hypothetical protein FD08_GL003003 [Lentilactobacillus parakefiri DSM 10551]PAL01564.1 hypothetical protein B8W96_01225 [Lentilactobacillus parakefiri]TDG94411.1 hypothetical protein C5L28_001676 [Lentilactobacillus parakefiri]GAW71773.1 hypothetical protein LPKJCM_00876 [Lentilactobacillus parakefiri]